MDKRLVKATINHLGNETYLQDVYNHGANMGFPGFTYHTEMIKFFKKYKKEIMELAENTVANLGEDVLGMIANFNCLKDAKFSSSQIGKVLYGRFFDNPDSIIIINALSWFVLEEVARYKMEEI